MPSLVLNIDVKDDGSAKVKTFTDTVSAARGPLGALKNATDSSSASMHTHGGMAAELGHEIQHLALGYVGAAVLIEGFKKVIETGIEEEKLANAFKAITGSIAAADLQLSFAAETADKLGINFEGAAKGLMILTASARGTALEGEEVHKIFEGVTSASGALGLSSESTTAVLQSMGIMMSKGVIQARDLREALEHNLPGAFHLAAEAMGTTTQGLKDMLKEGTVMADELLPKLAEKLSEVYSGAAIDNSHSMTAELNRMKNAFVEFADIVVKSPVWDVMIGGLQRASNLIQWVTYGVNEATGNISKKDLGDLNVELQDLINKRDQALKQGLGDYTESLDQNIAKYQARIKDLNTAGNPLQRPITADDEGALGKDELRDEIEKIRMLIDYSKELAGAEERLNALKVKAGAMSDVTAETAGFNIQRSMLNDELQASKDMIEVLKGKKDGTADVTKELGHQQIIQQKINELADTEKWTAVIRNNQLQLEKYNQTLEATKQSVEHANTMNSYAVDAGRMSPQSAAASGFAGQTRVADDELKKLQYDLSITGELGKQRDLENQIATLKRTQINSAEEYRAKVQQITDQETKGIIDSIKGETQLKAEQVARLETSLNSGTLNPAQVAQYDQAIKILKNDISGLSEISKGMSDAFGTAFESMIFDAKTFKDVALSLITEINKVILRALVLKPLEESLTRGISGGGWSLVGGVFGGVAAGAAGAAVTPSVPVAAGGLFGKVEAGDGVSLMGAAKSAYIAQSQPINLTVVNVASENDIHAAMSSDEGGAVIVNQWLKNHQRNGVTRQVIQGKG